MSEKRRITAKTSSGELMTLNYSQWACRNSCKKGAIQKRMSLRKQQLADGQPAYSLERVVGTETAGKQLYPRKPKVATREKEIFDMRRGFLRSALV